MRAVTHVRIDGRGRLEQARGRARRDRRFSTSRGQELRKSGSTVVDVASGHAATHVRINDRRHLEQACGRACQDRQSSTSRAGTWLRASCQWCATRRYSCKGEPRGRAWRLPGAMRNVGVSWGLHKADDSLDVLWLRALKTGLDTLRSDACGRRPQPCERSTRSRRCVSRNRTSARHALDAHQSSQWARLQRAHLRTLSSTTPCAPRAA
jgi:hypothetical protein